MAYIGGNIDVFIISGTKLAKDIKIYDGNELDSDGKMMEIKSNIDKAMNKKVIHGFKRI